MAGDDTKTGSEKPSDQRGGTVPGEREAREKGPWGGTAGGGSCPARGGAGSRPPAAAPRAGGGGSDAPSEMLEAAPGMDDAARGRTTGSNEPATDGGIDPAAGDGADATTDGGPEVPEGAEPDTKDVAAAAQRPDSGSAGG